MKLKNLTNQMQEIVVYASTMNGNNSFSIYVRAKGEADLDDKFTYPDLQKKISAGIFRVLAGVPEIESPVVPETPLSEVTNLEEKKEVSNEDRFSEEKDVTNVGEKEETVESTEGRFVCPQCSAEFASQRSLSMHISRSHAK